MDANIHCYLLKCRDKYFSPMAWKLRFFISSICHHIFGESGSKMLSKANTMSSRRNVFLLGAQTKEQASQIIRQKGVKSWINLNPGHDQSSVAQTVKELGVQYVNETLQVPDDLKQEKSEIFLSLCEKLPRPLCIECNTSYNSSAVWALHLARINGAGNGAEAIESARKEDLQFLSEGGSDLRKFVEETFSPAPTDEQMIFKQLFDWSGSSTYTYLLADRKTKECILIDPVLEQVDRDLEMVEGLGLKLLYGINTHCHADHVTGTGLLKERVVGMQSVISKASGAKADRLVSPGDQITFGSYSLEVLETPGHTTGCVTYVLSPKKGPKLAFTGDALLIGGCGRTDFQGGSSATLYESVHSQIFTLPTDTIILPAHDYKGRLRSTVEKEKSSNPRLSKDFETFADIMANLNLSYPKKIDVALPANMVCGIQT